MQGLTLLINNFGLVLGILALGVLLLVLLVVISLLLGYLSGA